MELSDLRRGNHPAQNVSGATVASNATVSGANLNPAKTGTWRNVSAVDVLNNGYGLWERA